MAGQGWISIMPIPIVKTDSPFWQLPVAAILEQVAGSPDGLSSAEAAARLAQFGPNLDRRERKRALVVQFLTKFRNPLVIILLTASALSAFTGDATSFFIIGTIVIMSVTLDFVQEYQAGQAAERLSQSVAVLTIQYFAGSITTSRHGRKRITNAMLYQLSYRGIRPE
jgi:Mg2+-importing ATPase